jgi:hypothetical protein
MDHNSRIDAVRDEIREMRVSMEGRLDRMLDATLREQARCGPGRRSQPDS